MSIGDNAVLRQAQAFGKLRELMGYIQDGSDVVLVIFQDDATGDYGISAKNYGQFLWNEVGSDFVTLIEEAHEKHKPEYSKY